MTREDFINIVKKESIDDPYFSDIVYKEDSFIIRYDGRKWVTYYCERGSIGFKRFYKT